MEILGERFNLGDVVQITHKVESDKYKGTSISAGRISYLGEFKNGDSVLHLDFDNGYSELIIAKTISKIEIC